MLKDFIEHFDAIILFDKFSGELVLQNKASLKLIDKVISNHDDLDSFFQQSGNSTSIPLLDIRNIQGVKYLIKRKIVNNCILYHFENNNFYLDIIEDMKKESSIDDLTSCYNKKETELVFKRMLSSYLRYNETYFTVVMFDLDHFKNVNDNHGHLAGDYILKTLSSVIHNQLRDSDIFGRVGGEEFTILLTQTKMSGALKIANKILKIVEDYEFIYNDIVIPITISMGITSILKNDSYFSLVDRTDKALYQAKSNGRNRVEYL